MTDTPSRKRQPRGTSTGGQFSAEQRSEAQVQIAAGGFPYETGISAQHAMHGAELARQIVKPHGADMHLTESFPDAIASGSNPIQGGVTLEYPSGVRSQIISHSYGLTVYNYALGESVFLENAGPDPETRSEDDPDIYAQAVAQARSYAVRERLERSAGYVLGESDDESHVTVESRDNPNYNGADDDVMGTITYHSEELRDIQGHDQGVTLTIRSSDAGIHSSHDIGPDEDIHLIADHLFREANLSPHNTASIISARAAYIARMSRAMF